MRPYRSLAPLALVLVLSPLGCGGTPTAATPPAPPKETAGPKAVFQGTEQGAGEVDYARAKDFNFAVSNAGDAPLQLTLAHKSCSCEEVQMPAGPVAPGGTGQVTIRWSPTPGTSGSTTVFVEIHTNDPKVPSQRLAVTALIKPLVHVLIEGKAEGNGPVTMVDFGDAAILAGQARVREVKVFSTELPAFDLDVTSTQPGLAVSKVPLAAGTRVGEYPTKSGYKVEVRTTDQLPIGYVRADLNLALSKLGDQPPRTVVVPVYAVVGSGAVSIRPPALTFTKPSITEEDTARVNLTFLSDKPTVELDSFEPKFLKVDAPEKTGDGKWRITAHLPAGNAEAAKYQADGDMEGQVVLKVSGLDRPVKIRVLWRPLPK